MRPPWLQVPIRALTLAYADLYKDPPERRGPWGPSARGCVGLVPAAALWMPGKRHWSLPHTAGGHGGGSVAAPGSSSGP